MIFVSKEARNLNIIAAILNITQHPGRAFLTSFRLNSLLLSNNFIILSQTCSKFHLMIELKIVKWKIAGKKIIDFADLLKSIAGFSLAINFELD